MSAKASLAKWATSSKPRLLFAEAQCRKATYLSGGRLVPPAQFSGHRLSLFKRHPQSLIVSRKLLEQLKLSKRRPRHLVRPNSHNVRNAHKLVVYKLSSKGLCPSRAPRLASPTHLFGGRQVHNVGLLRGGVAKEHSPLEGGVRKRQVGMRASGRSWGFQELAETEGMVKLLRDAKRKEKHLSRKVKGPEIEVDLDQLMSQGKAPRKRFSLRFLLETWGVSSPVCAD
jgi:hypothetical protein